MILAFIRREFLDNRKTPGIGHVGGDLAAQRSVTDRLQAFAQYLEHALLRKVGELLPEALQIAERVLVDETHKAEQFEQRVLQRRRRQEQLGLVAESLLQRVRDHVGRFIDVPEAVRFVEDDEIPGN